MYLIGNIMQKLHFTLMGLTVVILALVFMGTNIAAASLGATMAMLAPARPRQAWAISRNR